MSKRGTHILRWLAGSTLAAILVIWGTGCSFGLRGPAPRHTNLGAQLTVVPATLVGDHFLVSVDGEKSGPWTFLVDTGSTVTLVSPEYAAIEGYPRNVERNRVKVRGSTGDSVDLDEVTVRLIRLGDVAFESVPALIHNCEELSAHLGVKIDGILGFSLFRDVIATLDYPQRRLIMTAAAAPALIPGHTTPLLPDHRGPWVNVKIGDEMIAALIDTGSDAHLTLNPEASHLRFVNSPIEAGVAGSLAGDRQRFVGRLADAATLGPYVWSRPVVELTEQAPAMGAAMFKEFTLTFDQVRDTLTLYRPSLSAIPSQSPRSLGLSFSKALAYWRVVHVIAASPAAAAGLQSGDLITRINGEPVSAWSLDRFKTLVAQASPVRLTRLDGNAETTVDVTPFALLAES